MNAAEEREFQLEEQGMWHPYEINDDDQNY
jgi:hypothetical protein